MNWDEQGIKNITLLGFLSGGLDGVRMIVKIQTENESFFSFLTPPLYEIGEKLPEYMVDAAISKYGYELFDKETTIASKEEFQKFLQDGQKLNKQLTPKTF